MYLLVQAYQHLWLVPFHEVYQQFTYVGPAIKPGILSARCWQISHCLTALIRPFQVRLPFSFPHFIQESRLPLTEYKPVA